MLCNCASTLCFISIHQVASPHAASAVNVTVH